MKSRYYKTDLGSIHYFDFGLDIEETIVFLHGFTGSSRDFLEIPDSIIRNYRCLIPDLPGHGKTQVIETEINFNTAGQITLLKEWLTSLKQSKFHLFGYSMGGRLALQFAIKNYHQLHSLILVSTTAGIDEEVMRKVRVKADNELADKILNSNPGDFLTAWLAQPLFKEIADSQDITKEVIRRLPLQSSGLACSLKYFGSGVMPSVWHQLTNIKTSTLVIAGSKDQKYLALASKLVALIENSRLKVLPTGHAPLIESPTLLWKQVAEFLNDLNPDD